MSVIKKLTEPLTIARLLGDAERVFADVKAAGGWDSWQNGCPQLPRVKSFRSTASSMLLESIAGPDQITDLIAPLQTFLKGVFGGAVVCNLDQAWLRRQFPRALAPRIHHPHGWHQDGALGFDFTNHPDGGGADSLLNMLTAWIPLVPCGEDAPGLEMIGGRQRRLLGVRELADDSVRSAFPADGFCTPQLSAGDAVVMWGDVLHRTHVTAEMHKPRTSVEIRFHGADDIPARLSGQRFVRCC